MAKTLDDQGTQVTASPWKLPDAKQFMVCDAPGAMQNFWLVLSWLSEHQKHPETVFLIQKLPLFEKKCNTFSAELFFGHVVFYFFYHRLFAKFSSVLGGVLQQPVFFSEQGTGKTIVARNLAPECLVQ